MSTMSQRSHLTASEAWRVVGWLQGSQTQAKAALAIEVSQKWATEHVNWRRNECINVLFPDESRFSVHPNNRRIFIWKDHVSWNNLAFVHKSVRFGGGGVLKYGGIYIDGRTYLYIIRDGPMTARRYRNEIFRDIVVPYAAAIGDDFILMDDNCRPHRANLVEDFLFEEGIVRMEWPACSPDMNPIEYV
ncbi:transposable element Tcb2 transposase [Trichonephila clavipes]|nr:transposable element Tcb2 transposase [Trichonephila clavipes]